MFFTEMGRKSNAKLTAYNDGRYTGRVGDEN